MPRSITTAELCRGLGVSRTRVDQLISRAIIKPSHTPPPGMAREWSILDAFFLALYIDLADTFGISLDPIDGDGTLFILIRDLTRPGQLYEAGVTYLVLSRETVSLISATERGAKAKAAEIPAGLSDQVYPRIVRDAELASELARAQHTPAIVINLNAVEARLLEFWPRDE